MSSTNWKPSANNAIRPFAQEALPNVDAINPTEYETSYQRIHGLQPNIPADQRIINTALRQALHVIVGFCEFVCRYSQEGIEDDNDIQKAAESIENALRKLITDAPARATELVPGIIRIATLAEQAQGVLENAAITPRGLRYYTESTILEIQKYCLQHLEGITGSFISGDELENRLHDLKEAHDVDINNLLLVQNAFESLVKDLLQVSSPFSNNFGLIDDSQAQTVLSTWFSEIFPDVSSIPVNFTIRNEFDNSVWKWDGNLWLNTGDDPDNLYDRPTYRVNRISTWRETRSRKAGTAIDIGLEYSINRNMLLVVCNGSVIVPFQSVTHTEKIPYEYSQWLATTWNDANQKWNKIIKNPNPPYLEVVDEEGNITLVENPDYDNIYQYRELCPDGGYADGKPYDTDTKSTQITLAFDTKKDDVFHVWAVTSNVAIGQSMLDQYEKAAKEYSERALEGAERSETAASSSEDYHNLIEKNMEILAKNQIVVNADSYIQTPTALIHHIEFINLAADGSRYSEVPLPLATELAPGIMPKEAMRQLQKNTHDLYLILKALEEHDFVTKAELPVFSTATNETLGLVMGSLDNGKVYAEADGTMSVNGWDELAGKVNCLSPGMANITGLSSVMPSIVAVNGSGAIGASTEAARADHVHRGPEFGAPADLHFGSQTNEGYSNKIARADHTHAVPELPELPEADINTKGLIQIADITDTTSNDKAVTPEGLSYQLKENVLPTSGIFEPKDELELGTDASPIESIVTNNFTTKHFAVKSSGYSEYFSCVQAVVPEGSLMAINTDAMPINAETCILKSNSDFLGVKTNDVGLALGSGLVPKLENPVLVTLKGRVKVRIAGPVQRGQRIVPFENGLAKGFIAETSQENTGSLDPIVTTVTMSSRDVVVVMPEQQMPQRIIKISLAIGYALETNLDEDEKLVWCVLI